MAVDIGKKMEIIIPLINWLVRQTNDIEPSIRTDLTRPYQTWQHLAVSWSGKLSGINTRIYLDGQETLSVTRSVGWISDADNLFIWAIARNLRLLISRVGWMITDGTGQHRR